MADPAGNQPTAAAPETVSASAQREPAETLESKVSSAKSSPYSECRLAVIDCKMAICRCELSLQLGMLIRNSRSRRLVSLKRLKVDVTARLGVAEMQLASCQRWLASAESSLASCESGSASSSSPSVFSADDATGSEAIDWSDCPFSRHSAVEWMFYVDKKLEFVDSQLASIRSLGRGKSQGREGNCAEDCPGDIRKKVGC